MTLPEPQPLASSLHGEDGQETRRPVVTGQRAGERAGERAGRVGPHTGGEQGARERS